MPKAGENILKFYNHNKQLPVPFTIYADFEAIMKKVQSSNVLHSRALLQKVPLDV